MLLGRIVLVIAALVLTAIVYTEWETRRFMNPDRESVVKEIQWFTGYTLPDSAKIVFAKRSRPSPILGDYSTCAAIELNESEFATFLKKFSDETPKNILVGCPNRVAFDRVLKWVQFEIIGQGMVDEPDETYIALVDQQRHTVLLIMTIS